MCSLLDLSSFLVADTCCHPGCSVNCNNLAALLLGYFFIFNIKVVCISTMQRLGLGSISKKKIVKFSSS